MNSQRLLQWMIGVTFTAFFLSASCTLQAAAVYTGTANPGVGKGQAQFTDPFEYCAVVGTIDMPDKRYTGQKVPEVIVRGLREELKVPDDAPREWIVEGTVWRCMNGKVWACFVGANLPCTAKADTSRIPTSAMVDFCNANPTSDFIPAYITGRATVYEWRCTNGVPEIVRKLVTPDAQGFLSNIWYEISPR